MNEESRHNALFKALADSRRRAMLDLLSDQPLTTGALCRHFPQLNRCTVMQHLTVLEKAELIIVKREGKFRWNYLNSLPIKEVFERWLNPYALGTLDKLAQLKHALEGEASNREDRVRDEPSLVKGSESE